MNREQFAAGAEPKEALQYFFDISQVPRKSGHQQPISDYLAAFGRRLGLETFQDRARNVIIRKPAAPGYEAAPPVMLQAHMDMVCEQNPGVNHDFDHAPLTLRRDGDKITAAGTTLGADNGVGVGFIMAILADPNLPHPALEAVFTTDEETDMGGAFNLEYDLIKSRTVINLDSFAVKVCGSGELEVEMRFPKHTTAPAAGSLVYTIKIGGLYGGHTGQNAMAERGNAIVLLNRLLLNLGKKISYQLVTMQGGAGMSSAFARNSAATIAFAPGDLPAVKAIVAEYQAVYAKELAKRDPGVTLTLAPAVAFPAEVLDAPTTATLQRLLTILPDGVFSLNRDFPGAMESCSNVGVVETLEQEMFVTILIRSVIPGKKYYLYDKVTMLCDALGVAHTIGRDLPHWEYNVDERMAQLIAEIYPGMKLDLAQGTLECGIICSNLPGACVIALGSPYYDPHSPNEYFLISETEVYWRRLLKMLERLG